MADDWESALRKLTRRAPDEKIKQLIVDEMRGPSDDRSAALTCAALAEAMLASAISYCLDLNETSAKAFLVSPFAPLSSFDARIVAAEAMRIIGPETGRNLRAIKAVRNVFAHAMTSVTFDAAPIVRACDRLTLSDQAKFFVREELKRKARFRYCFACDGIFRALLNYVGFRALEGRKGILPVHPILP